MDVYWYSSVTTAPTPESSILDLADLWVSAAKEKKGDDEEREEQRLKEVEKDFFDMISSGEDTAAATAPAPAT